MGLPSQIAMALLREHRHKPISGQYLTIGRQTVYLTAEQAIAMVERELGFRPKANPHDLEVDAATRGSASGPFITDRAFLGLFSDASYRALDVTDYEGADIVADLSGELPANISGQFDFIVDGSCLDNIFDPAGAIRNLTRLLSPRGRMFLLNYSSRVYHAYVAFSLSWFHDFFALNEFEDAQIYLAQWDDDMFSARWDMYHYQPLLMRNGVPRYFGQDQYFYALRHGLVLAVAERGALTTWNRTPVQYQYRASTPWTRDGANSECGWLAGAAGEADPYFKSALRFSRSGRPVIVTEEETVMLPDKYYHYAEQIGYRGSIWPAA